MDILVEETSWTMGGWENIGGYMEIMSMWLGGDTKCLRGEYNFTRKVDLGFGWLNLVSEKAF